MTTPDFMRQAQDLRDDLIARRRDLHRHPELAFEEVRTAGIVADELNALGLEVQSGVGRTGVIGVLDGASEGPTVLVRADMDALPIDEANDTDYVSTVPGKMHACGHDGHTAIALSVARMLAPLRDQIKGRVKFVFQPAEEIGEGAAAMVADGALLNPRPDVALGLHLWNEQPVGQVGVVAGPMMAGSTEFHIHIQGKGGHGANPHQTRDPLLCGAHLVTAAQSIVSRNVAPLDSAVVSVTTFQAGTAFNIIPNEAKLSGTIRTFRPEVREFVCQRLEAIAQTTGATFGCEVGVVIKHNTEPVINHADVATRIQRAFGHVVKAEQLDTSPGVMTMAAEDVGVFMGDIPGAFFFVGSANKARDLHYAHHHPRFDFDEDALPLGAGLLATAIAEYVLNEA